MQMYASVCTTRFHVQKLYVVPHSVCHVKENQNVAMSLEGAADKFSP